MSQIRSVIVIMLVLLWTALLIPAHLILRVLVPGARYALPQIFHRGLCKLFRLEIITHGTPSTAKPTLFIINHISWLDIPVIGKTIKGSFVAKEEVASYPLVGFAAGLQDTIFISRTRPSVRIHKDSMQEHLARGDNMVLFPEGTSSNGLNLQKFKSAYFALAEQHAGDTPLTVQPVTLAYSRMDGLCITRNIMKIVAWIGDEELLGHVWNFLKAGQVTAELRFHPPITIDAYDSRKEMAAECQRIIAEGLARAMTGRPEPR